MRDETRPLALFVFIVCSAGIAFFPEYSQWFLMALLGLTSIIIFAFYFSRGDGLIPAHGGSEQHEPFMNVATAAWKGEFERVRKMLKSGLSPAQQMSEALHAAIENREGGVVKALLRSGADVEARSGNGWTPLLHAIDVEMSAPRGPDDPPPDPTFSALLIEHGADINSRGGWRQTPLAAAMSCGHARAVELLRACGARVW